MTVANGATVSIRLLGANRMTVANDATGITDGAVRFLRSVRGHWLKHAVPRSTMPAKRSADERPGVAGDDADDAATSGALEGHLNNVATT